MAKMSNSYLLLRGFSGHWLTVVVKDEVVDPAEEQIGCDEECVLWFQAPKELRQCHPSL